MRTTDSLVMGQRMENICKLLIQADYPTQRQMQG